MRAFKTQSRAGPSLEVFRVMFLLSLTITYLLRLTLPPVSLSLSLLEVLYSNLQQRSINILFLSSYLTLFFFSLSCKDIYQCFLVRDLRSIHLALHMLMQMHVSVWICVLWGSCPHTYSMCIHNAAVLLSVSCGFKVVSWVQSLHSTNFGVFVCVC